MAPLLRFETAECGFAHKVVERHSPQAGLFANRFVESESVHSAPTPVLFERRDTIDSPSGAPVVSTPPLTASAKALAGIIVFLGIVVLGVAGLRLRKILRNRRPKGITSPKLKALSLCESPLPEKIISERRNPMFTQTLLDFGYDALQPPLKAWTQPEKSNLVYSDSESQYVGWVPQIRSLPRDAKSAPSPDLNPRPFLSVSPPAPAATRMSRFSRLAAVFTRSPKPSVVSFDAVPPYSSVAPTPRSTSPVAPPSPLHTAGSSSPSLTSYSGPEQGHAPVKLSRNLPPICTPAPTMKLPRVPVPAYNAAPVPVITVAEVTQTILVDAASVGAGERNGMKSPSRLDSARPAESCASNPDGQLLHVSTVPRADNRSSSSSSTTGPSQENEGVLSRKKLPRLVTVNNTFTPSIQDELHIRVGEVLRLTREFKDGWCAVERIGTDAEQGVVPRFCVAERASFVPDHVKTQSLTNGARLTFTGSATYSRSTTATAPRSSGMS